MTDNQIDALIERQIEQHESWLEELTEQHWQQELEELTDEQWQQMLKELEDD
jgi:hypothetical protein